MRLLSLDLRVPWTARSNQSILKEINPEYSLEGLMLKLQCLPLDVKSWLIGKDRCWERLKAKEGTSDEVVRQHQQLSGHEFEQTPEDSEGQRSLACCSPWGCQCWTQFGDWTTKSLAPFLFRCVTWYLALLLLLDSCPLLGNTRFPSHWPFIYSKNKTKDLSRSPVVETVLPTQGVQVQSLVG